MKQTALMGLVLTLFMLLIVSATAFLFLFQGRQTLEQQLDKLQAETDALESQVTELNDNLATAQAARATVEADNVLLEGQLVESQQEVDRLTAELDELTTVLTQTNDALAQLELEQQQALEQGPFVAIVTPTEGAVFQTGQTIDFVVAANDPAGITAINLSINDETIGTFETEDRTLFVVQDSWTPTEVGSYQVGAMAVNVNGIASSPVTITLQVNDVESRNAAIRSGIEANVIELRGLEPLNPIVPTILSREELSQRIEADFAEEITPADARQDVLTLSAFDFVARDFDLYQAMIELYSGSILGFYDPETAEFVVVSDDDELDANEQWTHAHEFVHALQDQYFELELINDDALDAEADAALLALIEGEAEFIQYLYFTEGYFTDEQMQEIVDSFAETDTTLTDALPPVLISNLSFPYNAGFEFVSEVYEQGGFAAVNAVWDNPPQSTEHILHPDRYFAGDAPLSVSLPPLTDTLGAGWQLQDEDVFGEFLLGEYLRQQLRATEVTRAVTGWGGDRYAVYWDEAGQSLVMVLRLRWDTVVDSAEFAAVYPNYPSALYGVEGVTQPDGSTCWQGEDVICFYRNNLETLIVRAPRLATAAVVARVVNEP